jgi:hypothetical protein
MRAGCNGAPGTASKQTDDMSMRGSDAHTHQLAQDEMSPAKQNRTQAATWCQTTRVDDYSVSAMERDDRRTPR